MKLKKSSRKSLEFVKQLQIPHAGYYQAQGESVFFVTISVLNRNDW